MKKDISNKQLKDFGILIGFVFPIFIGWLIPLISGHFFKIWTLYISLPIMILAFLKPSLLVFPYKAWMQIGYLLGWINSRIILGIIFLVVVQPIAVVMKIFGYDPLRRKKRNTKSYRENKEGHKVDLTRIF